MWHRADMDINCRCIVIHLVNPTVRRGRDYRDPEYQRKFQETIERYMDEGLTLAQAINKATINVLPPNKVFEGYISFEDWKERMAA